MPALTNFIAKQAFTGLRYVDLKGVLQKLSFSVEGNSKDETITLEVTTGNTKRKFTTPSKVARSVAKSLAGLCYDVIRMTAHTK